MRKLSLLETVIMNNYELTEKEAIEYVADMKERVFCDNEDPEEVLYNEGLEPDYICDLIF